ncbi:hypothetical protein NBH00_05290 [Paraconexibacter antarcticus]|uniref:Uncharacterized protein n=1 Tax=Paraconexibacter antarcticus TaxID=2949664 RepID=A0ABY5DYB7_9ACTN|nr:hypothetical protein [Paraconexibacter antarcticus]UTI65625.1 hypothetical protein NBH00_05290 [Paraconexibacter antarcticus]
MKPPWVPPLGSLVQVHNPQPLSKGTVIGAPFLKNGTWRVSVQYHPYGYLPLVGGERPRGEVVASSMLDLLRPS